MEDTKGMDLEGIRKRNRELVKSLTPIYASDFWQGDYLALHEPAKDSKEFVEKSKKY